MSDTPNQLLPEGFVRGPLQGINIIGEITESAHRFLLDGWTYQTPPPRIEEDLSFVPKDREEVVYIYMYRVAQNTALMNSKHWRPAKVSIFGPRNESMIYYERAPLYLDVFYLISVHSKFRSDAERLMGWVLMRMHDATHLVYRPRKYTLPDGTAVDSMGQPWGVLNEGENVIMEKVSMALVDDLTVGDAINFYTINEAPFRPYLTYRAQCAMEGSLIAGPPTTIRHHRAKLVVPEGAPERPNGRPSARPVGSDGNKVHIGPPGFGYRPIEDDNESEE